MTNSTKHRTVAKTTRRPSGKTAEERKAQAEELQASIAAQVEQLRTSEAWTRFLEFARSFHAYSLNNLMLIMAQMPGATRVAGFRQWQAKGRQVRKGSKALKIFGYAEKKIYDTDDVSDRAEGELRGRIVEIDGKRVRIVPYFPVLSVFDMSQTDPIEGAEDATSPTTRLTGDDPNEITERTAAYLERAGWAVEFSPILGETDGYTDPKNRRVMIDNTTSPAHTAATMLHEAAHVIMHADDPEGDYRQHRGVKEVEAESVAYIVAGILGLDTAPASIGYLTSWSQADPDALRTTAANVLRSAHQLAAALEPADDQDKAADDQAGEGGPEAA